MADTDGRKLARQAQEKLRPDLPKAKPGSAAEAMGYEAEASAGLTSAFEVIQDPSCPPNEIRVVFGRDVEVARRHAWLEQRRTGIGASDIATINGWGFKDQSRWKLWAEKVGVISAGDDGVREEFEYGRRAEPMLAQWFHDKTDLHIAASQELRRHPEHDWMIATIDGEVFESPVPMIGDDELEVISLGGVEFKTTGDPPGIWEGGIPDRYAAQAQWQMAVCGWERVWFAVLHGRRFRVWGPLERDEGDIALLIESASKFWHDHVLTGIPPAIDDSEATGKALNEAYRGKMGEVIDLKAQRGELERLRNLKALYKRTEGEIQQIENDLKSLMGEATEATFGDAEKIELTWRPFERTTVDSERLRNEFRNVWGAVKVTKPQRAFRVLAEKADDEESF